MYPAELEIKDTTESTTSASYLDLLLSIGRDGQLHTSIYDKRNESLTRVQYLKCAYDPYRSFNPIKNGVYILVEVSILNFNYLVSVTAGGPVSPRGHM